MEIREEVLPADFADTVAQKVIERLHARHFPLMSQVQWMLPTFDDAESRSKWETDRFVPVMKTLLTQIGSRPDFEIEFVVTQPMQAEDSRFLGHLVNELIRQYPKRMFRFSQHWRDSSREKHEIEGMDRYVLSVEGPTDLNVVYENLEPKDVHVVYLLSADNMDKWLCTVEAAARKGYRSVTHLVELQNSPWTPEAVQTYERVLRQAQRSSVELGIAYTFFDEGLADARYRGVFWGCAAGRYRICIAPDGTVIPCQRFWFHPPLVAQWSCASIPEFFTNYHKRYVFTEQTLPAAECETCEVSRLCFGGCRTFTCDDAAFRRNETYCAIRKAEIAFLKTLPRAQVQ